VEVEGRLHPAGVGVADLHRIAVGRRHEFGIVLANITAALWVRAARLTATTSKLNSTRPYRIEKSAEI
jgi:hypothetical protein